MQKDSSINEMRKGFLVLAVLQTLRAQRMYTAELLERLSKTHFATQEGTLYPMLSKLKRDGLIEYEWEESSGGPPRKYYRLSDEGRKRADALLQYVGDIYKELGLLGKEKQK